MQTNHLTVCSKWILFHSFILSLIILVPSPCPSQTLNGSPDQIWTVGLNQWTVEEEYRFGKWVDENITEDFFIHYKIPTDCADAVYAIRWIYARIAHLPAAATAKDGKLIGHWSTKWKHLPTHPEWQHAQRFRAALLYILSETWTGTLPLDTYPVRISADSVTPGTILCMAESHCGIVGHICFGGSHGHPLQTWESMLPVKVRKLFLRSFFSPRPESKTHTGLVKFRWPILENERWKYFPVKEHPFYSEEQYTPGFYEGCNDFVEAVAKRIDPTNYASTEKLIRVMETITCLLRDRVPLVLAGYQECYNGGCPEGSEGWEIHGTSGRDGMIISLMDHLSQIIESNHLDRPVVKEMMEAISIDISPNRSITFYHVYQNHLWLSPHPEHSIEARWGLSKCEIIHAQRLTTKNSIAFIEKAYRKKDPKYADLSIFLQQRLLVNLSEEWAKSECREPSPATDRNPWHSPFRNDSIEARWGLKRCGMIHAQIRSTNDSIAFIEKTYRKKDPEYADFSIRRQKEILRRLNEELMKSECHFSAQVKY